jgi:putative membrane protein
MLRASAGVAHVESIAIESQDVETLMSRGFVVRLLINAAALWVASRVVPGVTYSGGWIPFLGVALIFGVINTFVGFTAKILTFPLIIVTLGIFIFIINGLMLWLTSAVSDALGLGFRVEGFWPAFWGALVVSLVSTALSLVMRPPRIIVHREW